MRERPLRQTECDETARLFHEAVNWVRAIRVRLSRCSELGKRLRPKYPCDRFSFATGAPGCRVPMASVLQWEV